ncbi:MAG: hypothetical protein WA970_18325 [Gammaproteobacteria bacterium]
MKSARTRMSPREAASSRNEKGQPRTVGLLVLVEGRRPNYNEISKGMGKVWADCPSFGVFVRLARRTMNKPGCPGRLTPKRKARHTPYLYPYLSKV